MKLKDLLARGFVVVWIAVFSGCGGSSGQASPAPDSAPMTGGKAVSPRGGAEDTAIAGQEKQPIPAATPETPVVASSTDQPSVRPAASPPKSDGEVQKISFDDLNCGMQADIVFRDWMLTERVKELDGRRVRISGYMLPFVKLKGISEFVLLRNTECKFGPGGQADHLIQVKLAPGVTTQYTLNPVEVVGQLKVKPTSGPDGLTWSLFDMTGQSVGVLRR